MNAIKYVKYWTHNKYSINDDLLWLHLKVKLVGDFDAEQSTGLTSH